MANKIRSSAYIIELQQTDLIKHLRRAFDNLIRMSLTNTEKITGDRILPCMTLDVISNQSEVASPHYTLDNNLLYQLWKTII